MGRSGILLIALLACSFQIGTGTNQSAIAFEDTKVGAGRNPSAIAFEAENYAENVRKLQILGNNFNLLVATFTTPQRFNDIIINAYSLASETQLAVLRSLNIITNVTSTLVKISQACAASQSAAQTKIIGQTNEQIKAALDPLKITEKELSTIKSRLDVNIANFNIDRIKVECRENASFIRVDIDYLVDCYRQIVKEANEYITLEINNINAVKSLISRIQLLPVFNNITTSAAIKAKAEAKDVLLVCQTPTEPISIDKEIYKLIVDNVNVIDSKINRVMNLLKVVNSRSSNLEAELNAGLDEYLDPMVALLNSSLNQIPNTISDISRDTLILPEVKAKILKNISTAVQNVLSANASQNISQLVFARLDIIKTRVTKDYVVSKCKLNEDIDAYNSCVKTVIEELSNTIKNASIYFDSLYNQTTQLNVSLSTTINNSLQTSLSGVYESTLLETLNKFTQSLGSGLSEINIALGNDYNKADEVLKGYKNTTAALIENTFDRITAALSFARQLNLTIDYDKVLPNLETLKETVKEQILNVLNNATEVGYNDVVTNATSINVNDIESILKNCSLQQKDLEQVVNNCIKPIITQLNKDLKTELSIINNSSQNVLNFIVKLERDLNLLVTNFSLEAYQTIKKASKDENTAVVVKFIETNIISKRSNIQIVLDNIRTELNKVKQQNLDSIRNVQNQIDNAVLSLSLSINITSTFNILANLTQPKLLLEKLTSDAKSLSNLTISNILNEYTGLVNNLTRQYLKLNDEFKSRVAVLNESTIINRCKDQSRDESVFALCVKNIITEYNNSIQNVSEDIHLNYNFVKNLTISIDAIITSKINNVLQPTVNISDTAATEIFIKYNITNNYVITNALSDIQQYNITSIRDTIAQLIASAQEIDKRVLAARSGANYTLFNSGTAVYDIVGIGKLLCGTSSVDKLVKDTADMVASSSKATLVESPDLSAVTDTLLAQSKDINSTLNYQLSLLDKDNLNKTCPPSLANSGSLQELHKCIVTQVNKFGVYFKAESGLLRSYRKNAFNAVNSSSEQLKKWSYDKVIPQSITISNRAKLAAEDFYKNCNITVDKIVTYSLNVAKGHFNNFQARISSNVTAINDLVYAISRKNYSSPNIRSRLQSVVSPVENSISAVLNSTNKSVITDELKRASEKLITDGLTSYNNYIANFTVNATNYKQQASNLVQIREEIQRNHNASYLYATCANVSSQFPLVEVSGCTNTLTYRNTFTVANSNTLNNLLSIKQQLSIYDSNWVALTASYANFIENEQKKSSNYLAYKIYKSAGLTVPKEVASAVDVNRCVQGVQLPTSEFICVIVV